MPQSILDQLMTFVRENMNVDPGDKYFTPDVDLFDYGYLDSFGIVGFTLMVKETWGLNMDSVDFYSDGFRTMQELAAYIEEHADNA
ncbi:acyl carrier protein [Desulfocurvus sp. DL9XJH121]